MGATRGTKSIVKKGGIRVIQNEIKAASEELSKLTVEFERMRSKIQYYRNKRNALETLLYERRQGQLPLLEHELLGGTDGQHATAE